MGDIELDVGLRVADIAMGMRKRTSIMIFMIQISYKRQMIKCNADNYYSQYPIELYLFAII